MKWYVMGLQRLLEQLTRDFNALSTETRIELLRLCPDMIVTLSRVVRYHEATRVWYEKKGQKDGKQEKVK